MQRPNTTGKTGICKYRLVYRHYGEADIHYIHKEKDFIDFNIQKLIPHKLSEYTPALATGDLNGDGFEDIVVGGAFGNGPTLLFQQSSGKFIEKSLLATLTDNKWETVNIALFDADGDKRP